MNSDRSKYDRRAIAIDRVLPTLAGGMLVVVLVAVLSFVMYTRSLEAPRTAIERDIVKYRAAIEQSPSTLTNHLLLARSYVDAGRKEDALATVRRARALSEAAIVDLTEAEVLRLSGSSEEALPLYDLAVLKAQEEHEQSLVELRGQTVTMEPPNTLLARALQGRAAALLESGELQRSIDDLEQASQILPTDADILVALGAHRLASQDMTGAAEAFIGALRFVPDHREALDGLEKAGVTTP